MGGGNLEWNSSVLLFGSLNPPANQPQVMPLAFRRSPIFLPFINIVVLSEQSSNSGSTLAISVPLMTASYLYVDGSLTFALLAIVITRLWVRVVL